VLPSEEDDVGLLIDEDVLTYSHSWKGGLGWEGPGGMNWGAGGEGMGVEGGGVAISVGA